LTPRSFVPLLAFLPALTIAAAASAQDSEVSLSTPTRLELENLSPADRAVLARELAPETKPRESDFLCWRDGCVGGSLALGGSQFHASPQGEVNGYGPLGLFTGLEAAAPVPGLSRYGVGIQASARYGIYDFTPISLVALGGLSPMRQEIYSVGVFRRPDPFGPARTRWGFGVAYDWSVNHNVGDFQMRYTIQQWRGKATYLLTSSHELGLWGAVHSGSPSPADQILRMAAPPGFPSRFRPIDQLNLLYKYHLPQGGSLQAWAGPGVGGRVAVASGFALVPTPDYQRMLWTAGARAEVPFAESWGVFGGMAYGLPTGPSTTQAIMHMSSIEAGVKFYWGGNARQRDDSGKRWMPYLDAPDNGNFVAQTNIPI
jgi:hypothetical protein